MTREQKMLAVVEAARSVLHGAPGAYERLSNALAALDVHTEADAETVTLEAFEDSGDGEWRFVRLGADGISRFRKNGWKPAGIVTLPITREGGR